MLLHYNTYLNIGIFMAFYSVKLATALSLMTLTMSTPLSANAGFLDSIYDVQNTISSIGRTADTIRGSKQAVTNLGEEVGFNSKPAQETLGALASGSVLLGKLQSTKLYPQANKSASPIAVLSNQDAMIYMGSEQDGYYYVHSDKGEGWVLKPLVAVQ